jgi:hypothetical protein
MEMEFFLRTLETRNVQPWKEWGASASIEDHRRAEK